jgi:hypothetical protein
MWNDKLDGYLIPDRNPTGIGTNFYPRVRIQISTHNLFADEQIITLTDSNPLSSLATTDMHRAQCTRGRKKGNNDYRSSLLVHLMTF